VNTLVPVGGELCIVVLCAVVLFGAGSGGGTLHHLERSWKVVVSAVQMELFLMVGQPFHLDLDPWNHIGACWMLCVVLCAVVLFGAGSGGWDPLHHLERSWKVVEVLLLHQMELFPHGWSTFPLGSGSLEPYGACWITLCGFVWCYLGLDLVVGPSTPPGTVLEGGGGPSLVPNGTSLMVLSPFLGSESLEPLLVPVGSLVWFFLCMSGVIWGWIRW
jgi:hypothetical protein